MCRAGEHHFSGDCDIRSHWKQYADFVCAGKKEAWIKVFNGRLDPFAAVSQKKLNLEKGQISDLSKWYAPFNRMFEVWKQASVLEMGAE
ncbi:MAG: hypothetical protein WA081_03945 [Desulfosalsimonadaceae bacterium]